MWPLIIVLAVLVLLVLWAISSYNRLVKFRNRTDNAWSQVDVQLKRRYDLVPNLVETVKGYAAHEQATFTEVVEARNQALSAQGVAETAAAESALTGALRHLFALSESYPQLRSSDNFGALQSQLSEIEDDIAVARQIFNDTTLTYNNAVQTIPTNIVASVTGFEKGTFFEVEAEGRSVPKVQF